MAKEPKTPKYDENKLYRVKLAKLAKHGNDILRPHDEHVMPGATISELEPQSAIKSVEAV